MLDMYGIIIFFSFAWKWTFGDYYGMAFILLFYCFITFLS